MAQKTVQEPIHRNGDVPDAAPEPIDANEPEQPMRVFGLSGAPVSFGGHEFHYARFTTQYVRRFIAYLDESADNLPPIAPLPDASLGEMVAEAVLSGDEKVHAQFERWLGHIIVEQVPPGICDDALPEEIAGMVDGFFHLSGFNLYGRTLKNLFAPESDALDASLREYLKKRREEKNSESAANAKPESGPTTEESPSTS